VVDLGSTEIDDIPGPSLAMCCSLLEIIQLLHAVRLESPYVDDESKNASDLMPEDECLGPNEGVENAEQMPLNKVDEQ
jgi:hypothetical protein